MEKGTNSPAIPSVKITADGAFWQIDFEEVRWSLPGNAKVLFAVRAAPRAGQSCSAAKSWSLSASAAGDGYRLHRFDKDLVPEGMADPAVTPQWLNVQVRAHRDL